MRIPKQRNRLTFLCIGGTRYNHFLRTLGHHVIAVVDSEDLKQHDDDHHCVQFWEPGALSVLVSEIIQKYSPNVLVQVDFHSPIIHAGLENHSIPKMLYTWTNAETSWYNHYGALFDYVFFAQKNSEVQLKPYQNKCGWLPFSHRIGREPKPYDERKYSISVCQIVDPQFTPKSQAIVNALAQNGIEVSVHGDVIWPFVDSKICLNIPEDNELSFPFFDISGFGSLMISSKVNNRDYFLEEGVEYLSFDTIEELIEKITWANNNPFEVQEIIRRGQIKILEAHTNQKRCEEIVKKGYALIGASKELSLLDKVHLGYAYQQCSQYDLPKPLETYCIDKAMELSEEVRYDTDARPWALLSNAILAFEHEDYLRGYRTIANVMEMPDNIEYRLQYYNYYVMLAVQSEYIFKAASKLREALTLYPDYPHFVRLAKAISLEDVEQKMKENELSKGK